MDKTTASLHNTTDFRILEHGTFGVELTAAARGKVDSSAHTICEHGMKPFDRLFYITEGKIVFGTEDELLTATAGDIVYLPSDCEYTSHWEVPGVYYTVNFILHDGCAAKRSIGEQIEIVASDNTGKYLSVYKRLCELWISDEPGRVYACISAFWELIRHLCIDAENNELRNRYDSVYGAIMWLRSNYHTETTPAELARLCNLSESTFRREFRKRTGMSPVKYRNLLRLERAKELMKSGEYNVSEAGAAVGFCDVYYFSRVYKKEYGTLPSEMLR